MLFSFSEERNSQYDSSVFTLLSTENDEIFNGIFLFIIYLFLVQMFKFPINKAKIIFETWESYIVYKFFIVSRFRL